jgi:hypothetical protein
VDETQQMPLKHCAGLVPPQQSRFSKQAWPGLTQQWLGMQPWPTGQMLPQIAPVQHSPSFAQ